MPPTRIQSLINFLQACGGKSPPDILKLFLTTLIKDNDVSESGSIHLYAPSDHKLHIFDQPFLLREQFLEEGEHWQETFEPNQGLAARAWFLRKRLYSNDAQKDPRFLQSDGRLPIKAIVCVPIIVRDPERPYGVVSFHNKERDDRSSAQGFDNDALDLIDAYVHVLTLALKAHPNLEPQRELADLLETLTSRVQQVTWEPQRTFLEETVRCLQARAYRAAIVMSWMTAYDCLLKWLLDDQARLQKFNNELTKRNRDTGKLGKPPYFGRVTRYDGFPHGERVVIEVCEAAQLFTKNDRQNLQQGLAFRNRHAHASEKRADALRAGAHVSNLVDDVILNKKFAISSAKSGV